MPCNSDYLNATGFEKEISRVACLLDEIDGKPINKTHWNGYHPHVYNQRLTKFEADEMVARLCSILKVSDVKTYSLEMQIWWRDHQEADKKREGQEGEA